MADKPTLYLKQTCPFCLKLRIFLTEAGIADRFDYVAFQDGDETHETLKKRMRDAGQEPSFPAADFGSGELQAGTDALIARFAEDAGADPASMPLLDYYSNGVFKRYGEMFHALRDRQSA